MNNYAFPYTHQGVVETEFGTSSYLETFPGLTKRDLFAAMAMQGLIGTFDVRQDTDRSLANASVIIADALIAALSKEPKP